MGLSKQDIVKTNNMDYFYDDGGRSKYFKGKRVGDCVARAIAIASEKDYKEVYDRLAEGNATQRKSKHSRTQKRTAIEGIHVKRKWFKDLMEEWGFKWHSTMQIGSGCQVHLHKDELPKGRLVVSVSKHYTTMIDGTIHDTYNPSREGSRCVYGYWEYVGPKKAKPTLEAYWGANSSGERTEIVESAFAYIKELEQKLI